MATTSNYGWTTPDDSSLVKDGASAIRTLGSAIDTSMNTALGTKKAGLVLLNTTSFSAVSSTSIPANSFSATYDNYRIVYDVTTSANTTVSGRLRASGSDISTANYNQHGVYSGGSAPTAVNSVTNTSWSLVPLNISPGFIVIELYKPNSSVAKSCSLISFDVNSGNLYNVALRFSTTTSADSFSIFPGSGTITGAFSVFGYNK